MQRTDRTENVRGKEVLESNLDVRPTLNSILEKILNWNKNNIKYLTHIKSCKRM